AVTNKILNDLVEVLQPRYMKIIAKFNTRGGIHSDVIVEYKKQ
ncbi:MAG: NADPH-dependent 7-cyano-7-deazaguanine reductase QueF, partial [Melioribacteraceae bacterium]